MLCLFTLHVNLGLNLDTYEKLNKKENNLFVISFFL